MNADPRGFQSGRLNEPQHKFILLPSNTIQTMHVSLYENYSCASVCPSVCQLWEVSENDSTQETRGCISGH